MNNSPAQPQPNSPKLLWIIVIVVAILLIAGGLWYWSANKSTQTTTTQTTTTPSPSESSSQSSEIKNDPDLQKAQSDLDNTNPDSLDTVLSQNDADASQF